MDKYLKNNYSFWQYGYNAPNVENVIFRLHGRILKYKYKTSPRKKTNCDTRFWLWSRSNCKLLSPTRL